MLKQSIFFCKNCHILSKLDFFGQNRLRICTIREFSWTISSLSFCILCSKTHMNAYFRRLKCTFRHIWELFWNRMFLNVGKGLYFLSPSQEFQCYQKIRIPNKISASRRNKLSIKDDWSTYAKFWQKYQKGLEYVNTTKFNDRSPKNNQRSVKLAKIFKCNWSFPPSEHYRTYLQYV